MEKHSAVFLWRYLASLWSVKLHACVYQRAPLASIDTSHFKKLEFLLTAKPKPKVKSERERQGEWGKKERQRDALVFSVTKKMTVRTVQPQKLCRANSYTWQEKSTNLNLILCAVCFFNKRRNIFHPCCMALMLTSIHQSDRLPTMYHHTTRARVYKTTKNSCFSTFIFYHIVHFAFVSSRSIPLPPGGMMSCVCIKYILHGFIALKWCLNSLWTTRMYALSLIHHCPH